MIKRGTIGGGKYPTTRPFDQSEISLKSATAPASNPQLQFSASTRFLHLFGLWAFAVAQPVLGRLGRNSSYLAIANFDTSTYWLMLLIVLLGIPASLFAMVQVAGRINRRAGLFIYFSFVLLLTTLLTLGFMNWFSTSFQLKAVGIPDSALLLSSMIFGTLFVYVYRRRAFVSQWVTLASLSAFFVPITYLASSQLQSYLFPAPVAAKPSIGHCDNPVPVVLINFDGLNGMALLNEHFALDDVRYPGFGRLAKSSTWYRNTSTVHYRTDNAVPALLTGRVPPGDLLPTEESYPDNLFRRIFDSGQYEMTVFEPFTRLCPAEVSVKPKRADLLSQQKSLLSTLALVYADTTLPDEFSAFDEVIPVSWFGLGDEPLFHKTTSAGVARYGWDSLRKEQLQHFCECLIPSEKPAFRFLHVVLPHYPSCYLPSGRSHSDLRATDLPVGAHGEFGEDWGPDELATNQAWQGYLLQLGFVDTCLSEILNQLEANRLFDDSLVIVTADHGAAFKAGLSRRVPSGETLEDIMPVPLFIKLPHQRSGSIADSNVETIDVLPTIADVLKMSPEVSADGHSLLDNKQPARLRKLMVGAAGPIIVEPEFHQKFNYAVRATKRFGSGNSDRLYMSLNVLPELTGRSVKDLYVVDDAGISVKLFDGAAGEVIATESKVPCRLNGDLRPEGHELPIRLAIAVNGLIRATTRTYNDPLIETQWAAMLPEFAFQLGENNVEIFEVQTADGKVELRRCPVRLE